MQSATEFCTMLPLNSQLTVRLLAGQSSTLTVEMQIFGSSVLPFTSDKQGIITQGMAAFLNSGVTASQIILTVETQIAGVSFTYCLKQYMSYSWSQELWHASY